MGGEGGGWNFSPSSPCRRNSGYHIAGNFQGRNLLRILRFYGYSQKFSQRNLGVWCPLVQHKRVIRESFLHENRIFHQFTKVFCYAVCLVIERRKSTVLSQTKHSQVSGIKVERKGSGDCLLVSLP